MGNTMGTSAIGNARVAAAANTIAAWLGMRDISALAGGELEREAGIPNGVADLFVLFGGGVVGSVDSLAEAIRSGVARRYAIVGGRGRATYLLDAAMERELATWGDSLCVHPVPGRDSEAEMIAALLGQRYGLTVDFLERSSTNCGNNITYLMDILEAEETPVRSIIFSQDAIMQRRMDLTWKRQVRDRPCLARACVINWAFYQASVYGDEAGLSYAQAPRGMWDMGTYLDMLVGEVDRLRDDEHGYGPCGRDFVVHVDMPDEVGSARALLASR